MTTDQLVEGASVERRRWLSVLAKARPAELAAAWEAVADHPQVRAIRAPETGLVLVRGRAGGSGDAFNLGEMTVTRAAVRLEGGLAGVGYVAGRDRRHAEIAATVDAMMQSRDHRALVEAPVVERLARAQEARRQEAARRAAATKVDFFTMTRTRGPQ